MRAFFLIAFILPLCAADANDRSTLACWLVMFHGAPTLTMRAALCAVNKYMKAESYKILDPCRAVLKSFVEQKYHADHCEITYSPDLLSAAIVEKTELESTDNGLMDQFIYIYFDDALKMREVFTPYRQLERKATHPPFFTPKYICLDFGVDTISRGFYWNRSTKVNGKASFHVNYHYSSTPTKWFIEKLPHLYAKIMQKSKCFRVFSEEYFTKNPFIGFTFYLADADILTPKDVTILNNFVPGGKNAEWCTVKKPTAKYLLLNLLACYGNDVDMLNLVDQHVGKQRIKSANCWTFVVSTCRDIVVCNRQHEYPGDRSTLTDRYDPKFSLVGNATLNYVQRLKKEGVFVEKDWSGNKPISLKKRMKYLQQALDFLRNKRMTFIPQENMLIRYDPLNDRVTVFRSFALQGLKKRLCEKVPTNIDPTSLNIDFNGQIEYKTI